MNINGLAGLVSLSPLRAWEELDANMLNIMELAREKALSTTWLTALS